jgi:hypothetical protein
MATSVELFRIDPKSQQLMPLDGIGGRSSKQPGSDLPTSIWTQYMGSAPVSQAPSGRAAAPTAEGDAKNGEDGKDANSEKAAGGSPAR